MTMVREKRFMDTESMAVDVCIHHIMVDFSLLCFPPVFSDFESFKENH